jgi:hypothetical protein
MSTLLGDRAEADRRAAIKAIAFETVSFSDLVMLEGGGFSFRQKAYIGTGRAS